MGISIWLRTGLREVTPFSPIFTVPIFFCRGKLMCVFAGHAAQWGQVKKKSVKDKGKIAGRTEGSSVTARGRGRGGAERSSDRGGRGRGGMTGARPGA